ncbi:MAG: type II toxin-antitoxin system RelE/ParE family toxin [Rickettsiales bacterium]
MIKIQQTHQFAKTYKKLKTNQRAAIDNAVKLIVKKPDIGERKKGDLAEVYVYKFSMFGQLTLLGYSYFEKELTILLLSVGSHENFYRDMKRN